MIKDTLRNLQNRFKRLRLKNQHFTVISNNCIAGCVLHDLGQRFYTPTVNLYIPFPDYTKFLQNLRHYVWAEIEDITSSLSTCPIGLVGGEIKVYFLHYKTFDDAKEAWCRRRERIDWENLYVVLVERDGCTADDLKEFDSLPYPNKIAFTHKKYPFIKSSFCIKGYEGKLELGNIMDYTGPFGKRVYDQFNWVRFFNQRCK